MINREAIYAALYQKLTTSAGYATTSRRLKHWADVPAEQQPALFMAQRNEVASVITGEPTVWTLNVDVYIYASNDGLADTGPIINPLLDAIEECLRPIHDGLPQTLGDLVHYARIEGSIETDEGTLGAQSVAIVPISIKIT
jgi:hypothetical protein